MAQLQCQQTHRKAAAYAATGARVTRYASRMPYIIRNAQGAITGLQLDAPCAGAEFLASNHPDLRAFIGLSGGEAFEHLDADFVRVIEDVIDTLIVKNVINITDLPVQAQAKLCARRSFRERISRHSLRLFADRGRADGSGDARPASVR